MRENLEGEARVWGEATSFTQDMLSHGPARHLEEHFVIQYCAGDPEEGPTSYLTHQPKSLFSYLNYYLQC